MPSQHVEFPGQGGHKLVGRLELPNGPTLAFAIHAHCFTCSKDGLAAFHVSKSLSRAGLGVLRFDFSGLGDSDGAFSETGFSSNVEDLLAAAEWLRQAHAAPRLLVGHSLGGAAVIAATGRIPEVRAVATIGAPFDPAIVVRQFGGKVEEIRSRGEASVRLAGREFIITRAMLEDFEAQPQIDRIRELRRPLLVLHSPLDATVPIDEAGRIFQTALHPKSFVSLDSADHLLTRPQDAQWVAGMIRAWAEPYLGIVGESST